MGGSVESLEPYFEGALSVLRSDFRCVVFQADAVVEPVKHVVDLRVGEHHVFEGAVVTGRVATGRDGEKVVTGRIALVFGELVFAGLVVGGLVVGELVVVGEFE